MFDLSDKVAVVTGGNGGIGLGIAIGLAEAGASIAVAARDQHKTADAVDQLGQLGVDTMGLTIDVSSETSVSNAISQASQRFGRIDILVNNAGAVIRKPPQDVTVDEWDQVQDVNLRGSFLCAREVYAIMVRAGGGKIINIGSMTSVFGSDWVVSYAASKGGVVQLTKSLALSWAKDNIQVNAILPGWIHTSLTAAIVEMAGDRRSHGQGTLLGGSMSGPIPLRAGGKAGAKRRLLVDGDCGPLSIVVAGARARCQAVGCDPGRHCGRTFTVDRGGTPTPVSGQRV